jgi:hypothetical protein
MFIIEDDFHTEVIGKQFGIFDSALNELRRIADIPFGEAPNKPPCTSWQDCLREYHIVNYDDSQNPWILLANNKILEISKTEVKWFYNK